MRFCLYIVLVTIFITSCITSQSFTMEDDIYYVPGKKALIVQEVEKNSGTKLINTRQMSANSEYLPYSANNSETVYENTGYWMGGYKGNERDIEEIERIINLYPQGFAFNNINGFEIALNLSFDPDWNVYTKDGRYWWFPSYSNINLYSSLLFGNYPRFSWTIAWESPRINTWNFDYYFNWGNTGWSFSWGWNYAGYDFWYRPWHTPYWYNNRSPYWYNNVYHPFYNHYPNRYYPHGIHHPNWITNPRPGIRPVSSARPNIGNSIQGVRPSTISRPNNTSNRPSSLSRPATTRPTNNSSVQQNTTTRPGSTTRPSVSPNTSKSEQRPSNSITRPSNSSRPNTTTRPGSTTKPANYQQPSSTTRPGSMTRPGNTTQSGNMTRPGSTTRSGSSQQPKITNRYQQQTQTKSNRSTTTRTNKSEKTTKTEQRKITMPTREETNKNSTTRSIIRPSYSNPNSYNERHEYFNNSSNTRSSNNRQVPPTQNNSSTSTRRR